MKYIPELADFDANHVFERLSSETGPVVLRGLAAEWPLVKTSEVSNSAASRYLLDYYKGAPVTAFVSESDIGGKIFYSEDLAETNFTQTKPQLDWVLDQISAYEEDLAAPTIYMGSMALSYCLPGLSEQNSLSLGDTEATVRIWIGNRTTVAAHYDVLENIACVCAGRRRFTLFPPDQLANLYVGPLDFTPAGQAISLVDLNNPDLEKFPRFAEALQHAQTALLEPGDAIFIPSMWWHHVEGLESLNILINHWWRDGPAYVGAPGDALLHAILSIRDLPDKQRAAWKGMFDHYVFEAPDEAVDHVPLERRGVLGEIDEDTARKIRATLRAKLNR